ncbi:MAG: hypothetical protein ACFFCW_44575 [Candidatus Hodarchaeota archaeon]
MLEKYVKYRWEFLRRNEEYIKDWNALQRITAGQFGKACPPEIASGNIITLDSSLPECATFCKKWEINEPLNPNFSPVSAWELGIVFSAFEGRGPIKIIDDGFDIAGIPWKKDGPIKMIKDPVLQQLFRRASRPVYKRNPKIEIDVAYSDNRIIEEFKDFLRWHRNSREPIDSSKKGKHHFDNFDMYLQVYDLRQEGKSWRDIKRILGLYSIDNARNHYKSACKLIKEGVVI